MAGSGEEWIDIFKQYNSGTYNNQWIIVNYARFTPGEPLPDGVLHVVEQIPTRVEFEDVTHYLRLGFAAHTAHAHAYRTRLPHTAHAYRTPHTHAARAARRLIAGRGGKQVLAELQHSLFREHLQRVGLHRT